jgi:Tfp pilus assembly protein PilN
VEAQVAQTAVTYTNALQLKARWQVLKDREELKFAALDCWNTTARYLPDGVTLNSLNFSQGKRLTLNGNAPADAISQLNDFENAMRKHTINGQPLFDVTKGETLNWRVQGSTANWTLGLELKRAEVMQ